MPAQFAPRNVHALQAAMHGADLTARAGQVRAQLEQEIQNRQSREMMQARDLGARSIENELERQFTKERDDSQQQNVLEQLAKRNEYESQQSDKRMTQEQAIAQQRQGYQLEQIQAREQAAVDTKFKTQYGAGYKELQAEADKSLDHDVYPTPGERLRHYTQTLDQNNEKMQFEEKMKMGQQALDNEDTRQREKLQKYRQEVEKDPKYDPVDESDTRRQQLLQQIDQADQQIILNAADSFTSGRRRSSSASQQPPPEWKEEQHPELGWVQRNQATGEMKPIREGAGSKLSTGSSPSGGGGSSRSSGGAPQFSSTGEKYTYYKQGATEWVADLVKSKGGIEVEVEVDVPDMVTGQPTGAKAKETRVISPFDPRYQAMEYDAIKRRMENQIRLDGELEQMVAQQQQQAMVAQQQQQALQASLKRMSIFQSMVPVGTPGIRLPEIMGGPPGPSWGNADMPGSPRPGNAPQSQSAEDGPQAPSGPFSGGGGYNWGKEQDEEENTPRWKRAVESVLMGMAPQPVYGQEGTVPSHGMGAGSTAKDLDRFLTHAGESQRSAAGDQRALRQRWGEQKGAEAVPIPKDRSALVKDQIYINARGDVAKWDGKQFLPVKE